MRLTSVIVMLVVAFCQAMATVSFQTVTNNRIITPSIMGFESLYVAVQTSSVYFMGAAGIIALQGQVQDFRVGKNGLTSHTTYQFWSAPQAVRGSVWALFQRFN